MSGQTGPVEIAPSILWGMYVLVSDEAAYSGEILIVLTDLALAEY